jgi:xylulokinase
MESLAFSFRENLEALLECGLSIDSIRSIGGGAKSDLWLQMKADVTGHAIEKPALTEAAVLGAAMIAAVGCGQFPALTDASIAFYKPRRRFAPDAANHRCYEEPYRRYRELCGRVYFSHS